MAHSLLLDLINITSAYAGMELYLDRLYDDPVTRIRNGMNQFTSLKRDQHEHEILYD